MNTIKIVSQEDLDSINSKLDLILSKLDSAPIDPPIPVDPDPIEGELNWNELLNSGKPIVLESGKKYYVPSYVSHYPTSDLLIKTNGPERATIIFGRSGYSNWDKGEAQPRFLFDSSRMDYNITISNVNIFSADPINEVQPFFLTLFRNTPVKDQNGAYKLSNSDTNCELALLYSGQQEVRQNVIAENVDFTGIMWQELKANNGGGLKSIMRDCVLNQVDPITHFEADLLFTSNEKVISSISFNRIDNEFNSRGNSCNILFVNGMTFYLPNTGEYGTERTIRPIPNEGQVINLSWTGQFLRTNEYSLQVGDVLEISGKQYQIKIKDRIPGTDFEKTGYSIDFKLNEDLTLPSRSIITAKVIKSCGLDLIGKTNQGYMIFKYNHQFQTNMDIDHGLEYMLKSNPFGVLSYNHKEITADWENVNHNGYYRQTSSGVGSSNGYRIENCTGLSPEFKPD